MIGIICAESEEIKEILAHFKNAHSEKVGIFRGSYGNLFGQPCIAVQSGVGKVHAAMCAEALIIKYNPNLILNIGVAGSLKKNILSGDIVIASGTIQHDFDVSAFLNRKKGEISGIDLQVIPCTQWVQDKLLCCGKSINPFAVHTGVILTGDQFINSGEAIIKLNQEFGGVACEMEAGSIAQVCYLNKIDFGVIKSISDSADNHAPKDFETFISIASKNTVEVLEKFIKSYQD